MKSKKASRRRKGYISTSPAAREHRLTIRLEQRNGVHVSGHYTYTGKIVDVAQAKRTRPNDLVEALTGHKADARRLKPVLLPTRCFLGKRCLGARDTTE